LAAHVCLLKAWLLLCTYVGVSQVQSELISLCNILFTSKNNWYSTVELL